MRRQRGVDHRMANSAEGIAICVGHLHERRIGGALDWRLDRVVAQSGVEPHNISACALLRAGVQPLYNDLMGRDFKDTSEAEKREIVREDVAQTLRL